MSQKINVNTTPGQFMPTLYYSQGDIGREFQIALLSSDGWSIPDGATVEMVATKPSGFGFTVAGTLSWAKYTSADPVRFFATVPNGLTPSISPSGSGNGLTNHTYTVCPRNMSPQPDKSVMVQSSFVGLTSHALVVRDDSKAELSQNAFKESVAGIKVLYQINETTETADPYQTPQIVNDFGTEEFVTTSIVPVGHNTDYPVNLVAKLEMAPNSPEGSGDFIVRQTNGVNEYVPLVIEDALPTIPSATGSYVLTVTVADGSDPVLAWTTQA